MLTWNLVFCRMRKDRHDGGAPSGFSRFPAAEGDSDEEEEYEKERRKRSKYFSILGLTLLLLIHMEDLIN